MRKTITLSLKPSLTKADVYGRAIKIARGELEGFKKIIKENPSLLKSIKAGAIVTPVVIKVEDAVETKGYRLSPHPRFSLTPGLRSRKRLGLFKHHSQGIKPNEVINISLDQARSQHIQSDGGEIIWPGIKKE